MFMFTHVKALPIVFIDDKYAGDYDTMQRHEESGKLNQLINMMGYDRQGEHGAAHMDRHTAWTDRSNVACPTDAPLGLLHVDIRTLGYMDAPPAKSDEVKKVDLEATSGTGAPTVSTVTKSFSTVSVSKPAAAAPAPAAAGGFVRFCPNCKHTPRAQHMHHVVHGMTFDMHRYVADGMRSVHLSRRYESG